MRTISFGTVVLFAATELILICPARSDPVGDFFRGRQITLDMATTPGGGYDAYGDDMAAFARSDLPP